MKIEAAYIIVTHVIQDRKAVTGWLKPLTKGE